MLKNEAAKLREEFSEIQAEKVDFSSIKTECPTCKRPFDESDIEEKQAELEKNFNLDKARRKEEVIEKGKIKVKEQEDIQEDIENYTLKLSEIENNINFNDIVNCLREHGVFCDCEVLANVEECL